MEKESDLQTKILNDLRSLGKYCTCTKIMRASDNGFPDIFFSTALTGGVFIETKRFNGKASRLQILRIKKLNSCGTKAMVCFSWAEWIAIKQKLNMEKETIKSAHHAV